MADNIRKGDPDDISDVDMEDIALSTVEISKPVSNKAKG